MLLLRLSHTHTDLHIALRPTDCPSPLSSQYFLDFAVPKLVFWVLSLLAVGLLCALRYPQLLRGPLGSLSHEVRKPRNANHLLTPHPTHPACQATTCVCRLKHPQEQLIATGKSPQI